MRCVDGIERRGRTYYLRIRVPRRFQSVEPRSEVNVSLRTRDRSTARERAVDMRRELEGNWTAALDSREVKPSIPPRCISASSDIVDRTTYVSRLEALVERIERVAPTMENDAKSVGQISEVSNPLPEMRLSALPDLIFKLRSASLSAFNKRQVRQWRGRYTAAAARFSDRHGDPVVTEITETDVMIYCESLQAQCDAGERSSNYLTKRIRHLRQMVDAYYEHVGVPKNRRRNPFKGYAIQRPRGEEVVSAPPLPTAWLHRVIIRGEGLEGLNDEARAIAVISAETGVRQSEIFDIPEQDIHLDHAIPHLKMQVVQEGNQRRLIKNNASKRPIILLGAALDAMRRHPTGFPRYRGKATYPAAINKYLRDRDLFPATPSPTGRKYSMAGTRHSFEDRLRAARVQNEERAWMMGHSVGKIRGRPVYGSAPDLQMRALFQEMVAFPTATWSPRPRDELWQTVDALTLELNFSFA